MGLPGSARAAEKTGKSGGVSEASRITLIRRAAREARGEGAQALPESEATVVFTPPHKLAPSVRSKPLLSRSQGIEEARLEEGERSAQLGRVAMS